MNTRIGDNILQDEPRCVAKFREHRPRGVETSVVGKKDKTRPKYNSLPLSLERYAGDCNNGSVRLDWGRSSINNRQTEITQLG